jgi:hypothetical protein
MFHNARAVKQSNSITCVSKNDVGRPEQWPAMERAHEIDPSAPGLGTARTFTDMSPSSVAAEGAKPHQAPK